jgi:hypothetical protein
MIQKAARRTAAASMGGRFRPRLTARVSPTLLRASVLGQHEGHIGGDGPWARPSTRHEVVGEPGGRAR